MNSARLSLGAVTAIVAVTASAWILGACGEDRDRFDNRDRSFDVDASADVSICGLQCSIDGRSVIDLCTGDVVDTCRPELACGAGRCQEPCAAAAEDKSSNGCEFYLQAPPAWTVAIAPSCYAAYIVNPSTQPITVSLELDGEELDLSKSIFRLNPSDASLTPHVGPIPPNESVALFLSDGDPSVPVLGSNTTVVPCPDGVVATTRVRSLLSGTAAYGSAFHLKTSVPAAVTTIYPFGGARSYQPAATLALPVATWAKQHILVNGWELGGGPSAQILASEDGTEVTILATRTLSGSESIAASPAGVPTTYRLDKGQLLQLIQPDEFSGSIVTSNKPTSTIGGNACAAIPANHSYCDILAQQIPAFEQWGSEYVGVGYRPRLGSEREAVPYRIVAARDETRLDYDPAIPPGAPTTLSAGEIATFFSGTGDAFVVRTQDAEHPIYLSAHMTGGLGSGEPGAGYAGWGDPEFVNVVPAGQYLNAYSFYADPTYAETSLVVVRSKTRGAFKDVWLECAGDLAGWRPVGTRGDYEFTRIDLSRGKKAGDAFDAGVCQYGLQRMRSEGPFTATIWGWDEAASYAYPGGMAQRKLVPTPLDPIR